MEQDVSPKKNANRYQQGQNLTVSNALDNESHKTCPNEEKQKEMNLRHFNLLKPRQAVHC